MITGKYNRRLSWEKQSIYDLDNGHRVTIEFSHYGDHISRIDWKGANGKPLYWHCSNGLDGTCGGSFTGELAALAGNPLPDFATPWLEPVIHTSLVRPNFEKVVV